MKKYIFNFIVLILFFSCSDDDFKEVDQSENKLSKQSRVQINKGQDVSKFAIDYIKIKTNNKFSVSSKKGEVRLVNSSLSKNDELGIVDTSKEVVVINDENTKHTFNVITPTESLNTITNLIIVERESYNYEYFLKYTFEGELPLNDETGTIDFSKFNGTIETFNAEGVLTGSITIEDGIITNNLGRLSPCPDDTQEPTDDNINTGSNTGSSDSGAGIPNDNQDDTPTSSGNGDPDQSSQFIDSNGDCGLTWSYERCGCGGDANGHAPQAGYSCCQGSPLVIRDCTGAIVAQRNSDIHTSLFKRNVFDPCNDGDIGVILHSLTEIEGLDQAIIDWLINNPEIRTEIELFYNQEYGDSMIDPFILELLRMLKDEISTELKVIKFMISAYRNDQIDNDLDTNFLTTILPQLDIQIGDDNQTDDILSYQVLATYFTVRCAVLRFNHPEWSNIKIYYEASKDLIHISLDVFGLVPIIGEVADLTNGVLYTVEGDGVNASLSYASAIPFYGWVTAGTKMGLKIVNAASDINTKVKLVWKITSTGVIDFGRRSQLRKVLGLAVGDARQAHHLIPWASKNHEVIQLASKSGDAFHMNEALNGIAVAAWRNQPNHNLYNERVTNRLNAILSTSPSPEQAYQRVSELIEGIRNAIVNNPNTHFNDLIF